MGITGLTRRRTLALLAVVSIVAGACGSSTPAASTGPTTAPSAASSAPSSAPSAAPSAGSSSAASGGTFIGSWTGPCCQGIDQLDVLSAGASGFWWTKIYDKLIYYEVKDNAYAGLIPGLADSWTSSPDGLTWTMKLHPNVKWHDGEPFTADDVKFSIELCDNPKNGGCAAAANITAIAGTAEFKAGTATEVTGVKVVDPLTVTITTTAPNAALLDGLTWVWMLPKHSLGQVAPDALAKSDWWSTKQIGTGPFKWSKYTAGQSIELAANADYWRGAPKLAGIIRRNFADVASALLAFDSGEIDMAYLTADEVEREQKNANATIFGGPSLATNAINYNPVKVPAFANAEFRMALSTAIDRQSLVQTFFKGNATPLGCFYSRPDFQGSVTVPPYDPQVAKDHLAKSGINPASLGTLVFDTYYNDKLSIDLMTAIQQSWKDVLGFNVTLQPMEVPAWTDRFYKQAAFDLSYSGGGNGPDPNAAYQYFYGPNAYPKGNNGFTGWSYQNPAMDKLLDQGLTTFDTAARAKVYQQVCELTATDLPWIWLWDANRYFIVNKRVSNVIITPGPGGGSRAYYDAAETWTKTTP